MKTVQNKQFFWSQILTIALLGGLLGGLLILLSTDLLLKIIFVVMGAITILSAIPSLILGMTYTGERAGKLALISAVVSIAMGIVLIFWHSSVIMLIAGVYFLLFPILEILLSKDRMRQFKSELPKLIIGVVLLVFGPAQALDVIFDVVGWIVIGMTVISIAFTLISYFKYQKKLQSTTGARVFVDQDGDGTIDAVYVDATEQKDSES